MVLIVSLDNPLMRCSLYSTGDQHVPVHGLCTSYTLPRKARRSLKSNARLIMVQSMYRTAVHASHSERNMQPAHTMAFAKLATVPHTKLKTQHPNVVQAACDTLSCHRRATRSMASYSFVYNNRERQCPLCCVTLTIK